MLVHVLTLFERLLVILFMLFNESSQSFTTPAPLKVNSVAVRTKNFTENTCYLIPVLMCFWLSGSNFNSQGKVILYAWPSERSHLGNKRNIHAFTYHQKLAFV